MTKQRTIAARDHGARVPKQSLDGMARGGCLPLVAIERIDAKDDLGDFLLRSAGATAIDALQHPAQTRALLPRQAGVGRNGTAMKGREETGDGFESVEAFQSKWYERAERFVSQRRERLNEAHGLAVAEIENPIGLAVGVNAGRGVDRRLRMGAGGQNGGRRAKNDGARIVLGQPYHPCFG